MIRNISRRVTFFFIASRRPGMAGCLGIGGLLCRPSKTYQITQKRGGSSESPWIFLEKIRIRIVLTESDSALARFRNELAAHLPGAELCDAAYASADINC